MAARYRLALLPHRKKILSSIQHKAGAWSVQRYAVSVRLTDDSTCE